MKRKIAISVLTLLIGIPTCIVLLPASLGQHAVDRIQGLNAIRFDGTIWDGSTTLIIQNGPTGELKWRLQDLRNEQSDAPLQLQPTFYWSFNNADIDLRGQLNLGSRDASLQAEGNLSSAALAPLLDRYDIFLSGDFVLKPSQLNVAYNTKSLHELTLPAPLEVIWSGGQISYILSDQYSQVELPSLRARVSQEKTKELTATVTPKLNDQELFNLALRTDGFVHIKLYRRFIDLLAYPWPGEQAPDDVVIEVERRLS